MEHHDQDRIQTPTVTETKHDPHQQYVLQKNVLYLIMLFFLRPRPGWSIGRS